MTLYKIVAKIKYLSNLEHTESSEDMQSNLEQIYDLLEEVWPNIDEEQEQD
jgi:Asp-tRNA(Asn)/Glu-tRNA(Gln) amidotransferase C subunit